MFGSQALETAIAIALVLSVVSTAASAITETIARLLSKRARDLQRSIGAMLAGSRSAMADQIAAVQSLTSTAAFDAARAGSGRTLLRRRPKEPSYLSARTFADAVVQMLLAPHDAAESSKVPQALQRNLTAILAETSGEIVEVKARLEGQFDELMDRAAGAYKRWASLVLACCGLVIAVAGNVSVIAVAQAAWTSGDGSWAMGWTEQTRQSLGSASWWDVLSWPGARWAAVTGWLLTALLVMLGGPFWFDALGRLTSLRSAGAKPPSAAVDPRSASAASALARRPGERPPPGDSGAGADQDDLAARLRAALGLASLVLPDPGESQSGVSQPGVSQPGDPVVSVEDSAVVNPAPRPPAEVVPHGSVVTRPGVPSAAGQVPQEQQTPEQQAQARTERAANARLHALVQVTRAQDAWSAAWSAKREARGARKQAREAEAAARRAEAAQRRATALAERTARPTGRAKTPARPAGKRAQRVWRVAAQPRKVAGLLARKAIPVLDDAASRLEARLAVGRAIRAREAERHRA